MSDLALIKSELPIVKDTDLAKPSRPFKDGGGMPPDHHYEVSITGYFDAEMCSLIENIFNRGKVLTRFVEINYSHDWDSSWDRAIGARTYGKPDFRIEFQTKR